MAPSMQPRRQRSPSARIEPLGSEHRFGRKRSTRATMKADLTFTGLPALVLLGVFIIHFSATDTAGGLGAKPTGPNSRPRVTRAT